VSILQQHTLCARSDHSSSAGVFAGTNKNKNNNDARNSGRTPDYEAKVCAVYAKSRNDWRSQDPAKVCSPSHASKLRFMELQVVLPWNLKGNSKSFETKRTKYIQETTSSDVTKVQRFAPLLEPPAGDPRDGTAPIRGEHLSS
jgi:hypothetical protein